MSPKPPSADKSNIRISERTFHTLEYRHSWPANATFAPPPPEEPDTFKKTLVKRVPELILQEPANNELAFFNWAPDRKWKDYKQEFYYDSTAGNDVKVYVIDSGANLDSVSDFCNGPNCES